MGNHKFRLSDMIPNAWLYKLKYLTKEQPKSQPMIPPSKNKNHPLPAPPLAAVKTTSNPPPANPEPRKSYHFTRELDSLSPPRKSKSSHSKPRKSSSRKKCGNNHNNNNNNNNSCNNNNNNNNNKQQQFSAGCTCRAAATATLRSHRSSKSTPPLADALPPEKAGSFDIFIDVDKSYKESYKITGFDFHLPPVLTKSKDDDDNKKTPRPAKRSTKGPNSKPDDRVKLNSRSPPSSRRFSVGSPGGAGMRLRINSPRIAGLSHNRQGQNGNLAPGRRSTSSSAPAPSSKRGSVSESFAVVKSSRDPQRDFRESMVEMIVQNNLRASKDLEDLLACYLSLNSDEYHEVIIKVFKQLWFDLLTDLPKRKG